MKKLMILLTTLCVLLCACGEKQESQEVAGGTEKTSIQIHTKDFEIEQYVIHYGVPNNFQNTSETWMYSKNELLPFAEVRVSESDSINVFLYDEEEFLKEQERLSKVVYGDDCKIECDGIERVEISGFESAVVKYRLQCGDTDRNNVQVSIKIKDNLFFTIVYSYDPNEEWEIIFEECKNIISVEEAKTEREYKREQALIGATEYFSDMQNVAVQETISNDVIKILNIFCTYSDGDSLDSLTDKIINIKSQDWFDYNYIMVDVWSDMFCRILTWTISGTDLRVIQEMQWLDSDVSQEENEDEEENIEKEEIVPTETLLYEDDNVKIYFKCIGARGVEFWVENLTDVNLTIQADSISINGISTNDIMMSDDVAPQSKGKVVAKCNDFSGVDNVETVGGQLRIVDFSSWESYDATFINVPIG